MILPVSWNIGKIVVHIRQNAVRNLYLPMLIGILIVVLLPEMPFVGWLMTLLIICFGLGSLLIYLWYLKNKPEAVQTNNIS